VEREESETDPLRVKSFDDLNEDTEEQLDPRIYRGLSVGARDWTVGTLVAQIEAGNIDLAPRYQRRSAWNDVKRSRYLESLIIGVPVPQLVLAELRGKPGKFVVIDGKQRLLTVAGLYSSDYDFWDNREFRGMLSLAELNTVAVDLFLSSSDYAEFRRQLENQSIRAALVVGTQSDDLLYDIFYRLNSGSVPLSGQELRQTILRGKFTDFLFEVTNTRQPIHDVMNIDGPDQRMYDSELVLRYIAAALSLVEYNGNLKGYLDTTTSRLNQNWDQYAKDVQHSYDGLNRAIENLSRVVSVTHIGRRRLESRFEGRLNKALLEVQLFYFSRLKNVPKNSAGRFDNALKQLCGNRAFAESIESTTKTIDRFRTRFLMFGELIDEVYGSAIEPPLIK